MNCSLPNLNQLPRSLISKTDHFILSNNILHSLCETPSVFENLKILELPRNFINHISEDFLETIKKSNIEKLDLSGNKLTRLSQTFKLLKPIKMLSLSDNPFICDCEMLWMSDWLANFTSAGTKIIKNYENITCHSGKMIGTPIYLLDRVKMGCYPEEFAPWKIGAIVSTGICVITAIIAAIIIIKRSREVRWLIYKNVGKLIKVEGKEDIVGYEFDAFLSYRY